MRTITTKNGKKMTLLNPSEKGAKFAKELKRDVRMTKSGQFKTDENRKAIHLTKEQRAYRAGYLAHSKDSANCYKATKKNKRK